MCVLLLSLISTYVFASKDQNLKISITLFTDKYFTVLLCALKISERENLWKKKKTNLY